MIAIYEFSCIQVTFYLSQWRACQLPSNRFLKNQKQKVIFSLDTTMNLPGKNTLTFLSFYFIQILKGTGT